MRVVDTVDLSPRHRGQGGFTIIEVVVAISVLLVGILSVLGVFNDTRDQNATGERMEIALLQAEQALEEMRGTPYSKLMLSAGAVDPTGGQRVLSGGSQFRVNANKTEPLVYYSTEGKPLADAWVDPVSAVEIGTADSHLDLTVYRFISWRDEECRVVDLSALGVNLPNAINEAQVPLTNLVNNVLQSLLGLLSGTDNNLINNLRNRLIDLNNAFNAREGQLAAALAGISQLDLCDINVSLLTDLQKLGKLNPGLAALNGLTDDLEAVQSALSSVCLPLVGCALNQTQRNAISAVNVQLDCLFGTNSAYAQFDSYLAGLASGLSNLANDVSNTVKNSKRISVAVVVTPKSGVGPIQPVWMSSVVRDPSAGLLSSGGTACQ